MYNINHIFVCFTLFCNCFAKALQFSKSLKVLYRVQGLNTSGARTKATKGEGEAAWRMGILLMFSFVELCLVLLADMVHGNFSFTG